jgi:hypothetical protein
MYTKSPRFNRGIFLRPFDAEMMNMSAFNFYQQYGAMLTEQQRPTDADREERHSKRAIVLAEVQRVARRGALTRLTPQNRLHREGGEGGLLA